MIRAEGLVKRFNGFAAVDGVTFSVEPGRILALLGPNGAGKTTTVRMLSAILMPTEGRAIVGGYDTRENPAAVRQQIGLLTEQPALYLRMRGGEYLEFFGQLYGMSPDLCRKRGQEWLERFAMPEAWDRRIGEYSKGMRQKLALVRALLHDPPVLLLDEPTSAMDPHSAKLVRDAILSLRDARRTILVCTHNLTEAELVADEIAIIRRGQIVALGTPAELKRQLLGPPLMELRLSTSVDGARPIVARWAPVVEEGPNWLRYRADAPETVNPLILQALAATKTPVVTLSEVPRSLEAVYLRVVEG
jgi:ABC-2 type transport system ATP-binding protein